MFDFANSGYTTVVLTAVFNAYFVSVVAGDAPWATFAWTLTLSLSYALVIVLMPALASWADARAAKKPLLLASAAGCIAGTALLSQAGPDALLLAVLAVVISNLCFSIGESLVAAFLPELARPQALGRVSGWGWSLGYVGGMLTLALCLGIVLTGQARGEPATELVPRTMLVTALVFAISVLPVAFLLRERAQPQPSRRVGLFDWWREARDTWHLTADNPDFRVLLRCGVLYQAGIAVVITLAAIYAEQALGFTLPQIMGLIFLVNIMAALGAVGFGYWQDRVGHRTALMITLAGWIVMVLMAVIEVHPATFWVAAALAGLCMGSSQSAGRALTGALCPPGMQARYFGLWTLATRIAFILGPISYGAVTWATQGNHTLALLATGLFFVAGLWQARGLSPAAPQSR